MSSAYIKKIKGTSVIEIDGKVYNGQAMTIPNNRNGNVRIDGEYYKALYKSGIEVFFVMCDLDFCGKEGYKNFCNEMNVIYESVPNAYIVPRISMHPSSEWVEKHPNAVVKYSDNNSYECTIRQESGSYKCKDAYSLYSKEWKEDAGKFLVDFIERISKENWYSRIIGYYLGAGSCSEWHSVGNLKIRIGEPYYDISEDFKEEYQEYLDNKYGKGVKEPKIPSNEYRHFIHTLDEEIALHSKSPSTYLKTLPEIPMVNSVGSFADIEKHQEVVDFYMALGIATAKSLVYFAKLIKDRYKDKLVGSFFGYTNGVHQTMNLTGLQVVLDSKVVDFCAAPNCYENRELGGNEPVRSIRDTYSLHDMVFFAEDDTRTHLEPFSARSSYSVYTEEDSIDVIKRNFAKNFLGHNYSWWYDQQLGGGRYNSKGILETFKKQSLIAKNSQNKELEKSNEIAFIFDIESAVSCSNYTSHQSISVLKNYELGRIGAGYDEYLLEDLSNSEMKDYKLYIFACVCNLDDKKREIVKKKLQKNHATALWLYGSGYLNPDSKNKISVENVKDLTGFNVEMELDTVYDGKFRVVGEHSIVKELMVRHDYGTYDKMMFSNQNKHFFYWLPYLAPRFSVKDDKAEVLGLFNEDQKVSFAVKEYDGFNSIFLGVKYVQYDVIRSIAKYSGVHIYSNCGDTMYFSNNYVSIHAKSSGVKTIKLNKKRSPYEVYEDRYYGESVEEFSFKVYEGQTKIFELR